ncbi:hypothetical protein Halar_3151 [halophilic archaeon DL31]|jgi:hypothetical protein|nr:hypothetical protein Halar_3151 [halophilic archaeon DL31]
MSPSGERPRAVQQLFIDAESARAGIKEGAKTEQFIRETNFDKSSVLVVSAAAWPSGYTAAVEQTERMDGEVQVSIAITNSGKTVGDDAAIHSLLVQITDLTRDDPTTIHVRINGERTGVATPSPSS